jgi:hypothetical protein
VLLAALWPREQAAVAPAAASPSSSSSGDDSGARVAAVASPTSVQAGEMFPALDSDDDDVVSLLSSGGPYNDSPPSWLPRRASTPSPRRQVRSDSFMAGAAAAAAWPGGAFDGGDIGLSFDLPSSTNVGAPRRLALDYAIDNQRPTPPIPVLREAT